MLRIYDWVLSQKKKKKEKDIWLSCLFNSLLLPLLMVYVFWVGTLIRFFLFFILIHRSKNGVAKINTPAILGVTIILSSLSISSFNYAWIYPKQSLFSFFFPLSIYPCICMLLFYFLFLRHLYIVSLPFRGILESKLEPCAHRVFVVQSY